MGKWADYLISAVKYDDQHKITEIKQHKDTEDGVGKEQIIDRATLADNLKKYSYVTIFSSLSTWKKGEKLRIFNHDGDYYIRIDDNKVNHDHLGMLPDF